MSALLGASRDSLAAVRERMDGVVGGLGADDLEALGADLFQVADLLHREGRLRRTLADPSMAPDAKTRLAEGLLAEQLSATAVELVGELVKARWSRPIDLVAAAEFLGVQAVLASAEERNQLEEVEDELFRFGRILERQAELTVVLTNASMPVEPRLRLLDDLLGGKVSAATLTLVHEAVRAPRGRRIERSLEEYVRLAAERRQRLIAEVHAAAPLTDQQIDRLSRALSDLYGRRIHVQVAVDPQLLGGLVVRVGDEVIEGSVLHRLQQAQRQIAG